MRHLILLILLYSSVTRAEPVLLVAYHHSPPYSVVHQDGSVSGMDLEILHLLGERLHFHVQPMVCPFSRCLRLIKEGKADLLMGILKTPARSQYMNYIDPPYYALRSSFGFYKRRDADFTVGNYDDLKDHSIAYIRGGVYFPRFDHDDSLKKVSALSDETQVNLLLRHRVDLAISIDSTFDIALDSLGVRDQIIKTRYQKEMPVSSYMALARQSAFNKMIPEISQALRQLRDNGQLNKILARYGIPLWPEK